MLSYIALVPLLPLLALFPLGVIGRDRQTGAKIGGYALVAAFLGALIALTEVSSNGELRIRFYEPASAIGFVFPMGFYIDRLSAVMMVLITGVSTIIYVYSMRYMQQEPGYTRFHILLALTTSVLLCMVASANLLMLFIFWQLLSWLVPFLSYQYSHRPTIQGAFKTFTVQRVGDLAFLAGILLTYHVYETWDYQLLFARATEAPHMLSLRPDIGLEVSAPAAISLLLFIAGMSKSAQFPMHVWLPSSLYAPTQVCALLHAGIINAGGFLINRLAPLYGLAPSILHIAFIVGGLTAIMAASIMLTRSDIKTMLGFSTIGQMGYMIMECGLGAFALAIFHLIAHGLFKATVFLNCGNVIHMARHEPRLPPGYVPEEAEEKLLLPWTTGVLLTLVFPLIIVLAAHGVLRLSLQEVQGTVIFLFFAWVTSAQSILSLYRLRAVGSRKVAGVMALTVFFVISTYLWAADRFTHFLYPAPGEAARYFEAAAFPPWLFDLFVGTVTVLIVTGWAVVYTNIRGEHRLLPRWAAGIMPALYVWFWNGLYLDALYTKLGERLGRFARRADAALPEWLP